MAQIDHHYQHWDGAHENIWRRRWTIALEGLRTCMAQKWLKRIVGLCWVICLAQTVLLFLYASMLDPESRVSGWVQDLGGRPVLVAQEVMAKWASKNPEIAIGLPYNIMFSFFSSHQLFTYSFTMLALCLAVPRLITPDLSSRAIVIYSSTAVSRFDYLLGKFGAVMLLMTLTWLGPVLISWLAGNLFSPRLAFLWHSRAAFLHSASYIVISMVVLSMLVLAISASSRKSKTVVTLWLGLWLLGAALSAMGTASHVHWLQYVSFGFNLDVLHRAIFDFSGSLATIEAKVPRLSEAFAFVFDYLKSSHGTLAGALFSLVLMLGGAGFILHQRVKPE
ncbi:MAG: hypothetical protein VX705_08925 [Verrucomicrobiota bacterium]|nr:hypothetical protein [Verrucomicrobiota bacterium]